MSLPIDERPRHDRWAAFGLGVLGGVVGGLSLLSFAGIFVVSAIAIGVGLLVRPRPFGAAGVLLGWCVTWWIVLEAAQSRCGQGCTRPDLTPWLAVAGAVGTVGAVLLLVGVRMAGSKEG